MCLKKRRKGISGATKVNRARETADLGICKAFILAGAQSLLDLSLARMSFVSVTLIHKTESKFS